MVSSSDTGVSDTVHPTAIVSDDEMPSEGDVYTSDTTSTDDDDFQPFALPDIGVEIQPADGILAGDLPLAVIPAPALLAALPVADVPLDVVSDDDIDLFEEGPYEDDYEGGAPIDVDAVLPIAEAPIEEAPLGSPGPDSLESVASASFHDQGVQHHSPDADPDVAMSAAPGPLHNFELDHEIDDDFDPVFPPDFDLDHEIEFIHMDQPLEAPVAPIDPLFDIPADFDMDLGDPELVMAPEPVVAPDPALEHDPVLDDAPALAPPIVDLPIAAPPVVDDPIVDAPLHDPVPVLVDRATFASHIDPRYADTRNGWIEDDDDYQPFVLPVTPPVAPVSAPTEFPLFHPHTTDVHRTDLPITFLQDIPLPCLGRPFALPDFGDEVQPADGILAGDLPLAEIPAPAPLAAFPVEDLPLDVVSDDDIDLFVEGPPEDDHEGGAPIADDVVITIAQAHVEEAPSDSPGPDSSESVASASLHNRCVQHYSPGADLDIAMSVAPGAPHEFEFDHEFEDEFDPVFPPDFDLDHEIEFIPVDQPLEAPVAPIDHFLDIPADLDMDFVDPEPVVAPKPVIAPDPVPVHDPVLVDAPALAPPIVDIPIVAPPVVDVPIADAPVLAPPVVDHALFATHVDPRYADTHNGWIDDDDYAPSCKKSTGVHTCMRVDWCNWEVEIAVKHS
ncbi:calphotin-like [Helianthus annuus]|uniref:calphotin-like n=1 Tax=Helianthus annuus TaxID=4232 RepID=UPI0016531A10|nr:calphotin-like [Helianthus annuus]